MGYYTKYDLSNEDSLPAGFEQKFEEITGESLDSLTGEACKWYDHRDHMKALSREFPGTTLVLQGNGEEYGDIWVAYYRNGREEKLTAQIVWPQIDPAFFNDDEAS